MTVNDAVPPSPERRIRLGILDAVPAEYLLPGEKSDPEKFIDLFQSVNARLDFQVYEPTRLHFPEAVNACDAYLITGSPCSAYEPLEWIPPLESFVRDVYRASIPLVGICFGHQLIAQALGGKVAKADAGWVLGMHDFTITRRQAWMTDASAGHALHFINQDQVVRLPPGVDLWASSDDCPVIMYGEGNRLLCLQGHPEQPESSMRAFAEKLTELGKISDMRAQQAFRSMEARRPDSDLVGRWLSTFLGVD
ncbi:MAG: type 1 glutamine amidotransferase [Steroidobacteraceae bacterium]